MNYFIEEVGITSQVFDYLFDGDFEIKEIEEALVKEAKVSANGEYCPTCGAKLSDLEKGARSS